MLSALYVNIAKMLPFFAVLCNVTVLPQGTLGRIEAPEVPSAHLSPCGGEKRGIKGKIKST